MKVFADANLIWVDYASQWFADNPWYATWHPPVMAVLIILLNGVTGSWLGPYAAYSWTKYHVGSGFLRFVIAIPVTVLMSSAAILLGLALHTLGAAAVVTRFARWGYMLVAG